MLEIFFRHRLGVALPCIELNEVTIGFEGEKVLDRVSLSIAEGESFVLIGPSGQGKSVLLKVMAGLLGPESGSVAIRGHNFLETSGASRQEIVRKMGMLFQKNALFDSLTNGENIAFPLREVTSLTSAEVDQTVDRFLEAVGLSHVKFLYPDEISGGMQKRLGIARALALNPEIIMYDDPTAGLDPITSRKIVELILSLKEKNRSTVVAVTNDINRAYQMADRIGMVVDHGIIVTGTVEETKKHSDPRVRQFIHGDLQGPLTGIE